MVNRTPPQTRDSAVGIPPLSLLHREGRIHEADNINREQQASEWEEESQAQESSLRDQRSLNFKNGVNERSKKRNSHGRNLRRYNHHRDEQNPQPQTPTTESKTNIELASVLNSLREEMNRQSHEL